MSLIKHSTIILKYTAFAVLFSIALSGCSILPKKKSTVDPRTTNLVVWSFENEDVWKPIIKDFEKQNKGYTMVYEKQTFDDSYENRVLNSILATRKPDVWAMPNDWVYRHKDKFYPMPDTMVATTKLSDTYVQSIAQSVLFDNKIYALAPTTDPLIVYYNPNLFNKALDNFTLTTKDKTALSRANSLLSEPPKIWSDIIAASNLITQKSGNNITLSGIALGTTKIYNSQDILYAMMLQNETKVTSEDYKLATFNLPTNTSTGTNDTPGKRALEFYTSFADPSSPNYSWNDSLGDELQAFADGKVAMIVGYSSLQTQILQRFPGLSFTYKKTYLPQVNADNSKIVDFARFTALGVNSISLMPTQAWNLINIAHSSYSESFASNSRLFSSKKASSYDISFTNRTAGNPEKLTLATAKSLIKGRYPVEFDSITKSMIDSLNAKTSDSQTIIDTAANRATELLRKESW